MDLRGFRIYNTKDQTVLLYNMHDTSHPIKTWHVQPCPKRHLCSSMSDTYKYVHLYSYQKSYKMKYVMPPF